MKVIRLGVAVAVLIVVGVGVVMWSRQGDDSAPSVPGPAARTEAFERALIKGDCPAFKKLVVAPAQFDCAQLGEMSQSAKDIDPAKISYTVVFKDGESATVRVTMGGEKHNLNLVMVKGQWLVILDSDV